jgi:hypothetical protein
MTGKFKLMVAAALATAMLTSSAFAATRSAETVLDPSSPVATGGGSLGYNVMQQNSDAN